MSDRSILIVFTKLALSRQRLAWYFYVTSHCRHGHLSLRIPFFQRGISQVFHIAPPSATLLRNQSKWQLFWWTHFKFCVIEAQCIEWMLKFQIQKQPDPNEATKRECAQSHASYPVRMIQKICANHVSTSVMCRQSSILPHLIRAFFDVDRMRYSLFALDLLCLS